MPTQAGGVERGEAGKRSHDCDSLDTERSSISTTSSATSSSNGRHWTSTSASKLSKVGVDGADDDKLQYRKLVFSISML